MKISQTQDVNISDRFTFSTRVENAKIQVICGPMFSGKTNTLIRAIEEYREQGKAVHVFKPSIDDRYAKDTIVSHDQEEVDALNISQSEDILALSKDADVIAIDEAQFFDVGIVRVCQEITGQGKSLVIAGLDMDYTASPFGAMPLLLSMADEVLKLNSVCTFCSGRARYSHRVSKEGGIVVIGEKDKYVPLCRSCYHELK